MSFLTGDIRDTLLYLSSINGNRDSGSIISKEIKVNVELVGENFWSIKTNNTTNRHSPTGFSLNGFGYVCHGGVTVGAPAAPDLNITQQYSDNLDSWTTKATAGTARLGTGGFSVNEYGYSCCGMINSTGVFHNEVNKYDGCSNVWTTKATCGTARERPSGFGLNGFGYMCNGSNSGGASNECNQYNDAIDTWVIKANAGSTRQGTGAFTLNGYGYSCMGFSSTDIAKYDDSLNTWSLKNECIQERYCAGIGTSGYGYIGFGNSTYGFYCYNDIIDSWSKKAETVNPRSSAAAFNVNECVYGCNGVSDVGNAINEVGKYIGANFYYLGRFKSSVKPPKNILVATNINGYSKSLPIMIRTNQTHWMFMESNKNSIIKSGKTITTDISANTNGFYNYEICVGIPGTNLISGSPYLEASGFGSGYWVTKSPLTTATQKPAAFSTNGYAYLCTGYTGTNQNTNFQYSDAIHSWSTKSSTGLTARTDATGFSLNGFGYVTGGFIAAVSALHEQYNTYTDTWVSKTAVGTARRSLFSFSLNGFGYISSGFTTAVTNVNDRYNDSLNTWTTKAINAASSRDRAAFSLNGYGFTLHGFTTVVVNTINLYNDASNAWLAKTAGGTARRDLSGFSLNGFGYICGGFTTVIVNQVDQYDLDGDLTTSKMYAGSTRRQTAGFNLNDSGYHCAGATVTNSTYSAETNQYVLNTPVPLLTTTLFVGE